MHSSTWIKGSLLLTGLSVASLVAHADAFTPAYIANVKAEGQSQFMTGVRGSCSEASHIAAGPVGSDLTEHQTSFVCDAAIFTTFDKRNVHTMVTFAKKSATGEIISFAGLMDAKTNTMDVQKVYFEPGKATYVDVGACKVFFSHSHISGVFCGGKIDADGQRTVASIAFKADPGQ